jgi:Rrf2 family transcriptional regulator, nitric oxide-sensitive transcriptional repressor
MRVTRFSDIGLRVLIYLSRTGPDRACPTVAEISTQFSIPLNHLVKVVGHLARAGWIQATRGRNGGVRLCVDPATLKIGGVLRELEGDAELVDCENRDCLLSRDCRLRAALRVGLRAFYDAMDAYTLEDITRGATGQQIVRMHRDFLSRLPAAGRPPH